jgi:NADPH:quinone reductase-like Zn-dependent oxidoreductase
LAATLITGLNCLRNTTIFQNSRSHINESNKKENFMAITMTETMKAVQIHKFGGPEVLKLEDVPRPEPGPNEVQVRIHAAGVNPVDWKIREGKMGNIPLPSIMGVEFSGEVEALGPEVTEFRVGEAVFGSVSDSSGGYAEYALAPVSQIIEKPAALDHVRAAALPVASMTAWQALFDEAKLRKGQKILIHAAAGGVGGFAVQFAKWKGAYVIGTASGANTDFVRSLGAHEVIDYRTSQFEDMVRDADMVFDTIGGETQERSWKVLKKGGVLVSVVQPPSEKTAAANGARGIFMRQDSTRTEELRQIAELVASGQIKVIVETILPLREARKAQELSQSGHAHGKIVLAIDPEAGVVL